ncbi:MAG: response regulator transcription factor [Gammaproteobacteria bacterium]
MIDTMHEIPAPALILVDDDPAFCEVLGDALARRGFDTFIAHNVEDGLRLAEQHAPGYAVVDLRMPGPSGLELVAHLRAQDPEMKIVVLTGYASITTAVEAIKLGATYYLTKPTDADEIMAAFHRDNGNTRAKAAPHPISMDRIEWEHIQRVMVECGGNVSEGARRLGMHRRTLQRKLNKRPAPV